MTANFLRSQLKQGLTTTAAELVATLFYQSGNNHMALNTRLMNYGKAETAAD